MKRFFYLAMMLAVSIMTFTFFACGGDDSTSAGGNGSGNGEGGSNSGGTTSISIVGTWRAYYQRNGVQLYDLVKFNADHTGYVIEEVGNGSDNPTNFTWTQDGNVIKVILEDNYTITWTIQQIIDDNTVTISDGKRTYNVVRDGTGGGGSTPTATFNIIGTWRAYYQSKDTSRGEVYDLVTFNSDYTGTVIEEVGYGSDNPVSFIWKQTGNIIQVSYGGETITWTIQQIIDNNTVVVNDGKKDIKVYRDGTGGGTSSSNFVSKGGGSLSVAQLLGTWQAYQVEYYGVENGQVYNQSYEIYPNDQSKGMTTCYRYEFYADYTYKSTEYYNGEWIAPRNYSYREAGGRIYLPEGGSPAPEYCMVTANKTRSDEIVITTHYTDNDMYIEYLLKRVEGGETPATNPVLGTFNFVYQSYYDETPYDYYGGFVTIDEDPYNTVGENSINIANLYLEGSNLVGYYDLDKDSVYIAAWQTIGVSGEYGLITVNWKDTKSDWIPFSINKDGSLTSDRFGVYSYDADFVEQKGWWEAATIATLTPTNSASSRRTSAKRSVTTKAMRINKVRLSNKRVKK